MGLLLDRIKQIELGLPNPAIELEPKHHHARKRRHTAAHKKRDCFPDLGEIPPELSLQILKYLNATDLCLAACVWSSLANDDILWQSLCKSTWGYTSIYEKLNSVTLFHTASSESTQKTFRKIYMQLDEATLTFNADWRKGLEYLFKQNLLEDKPLEIARFINSTKKLSREQKEKLFKENKAVLENVIIMHNYAKQFLPTALRCFFSKIEAPRERNDYLSFLLEKFSKRFVLCNPELGLSEDAVYIICFSLILLSVDLTSPAVKNKMSKREFIKNTRNALPELNPDFTGHLYDNIYLNGSIATPANSSNDLVTVR